MSSTSPVSVQTSSRLVPSRLERLQRLTCHGAPCIRSNKKQYVDCTVLEPADCQGDTVMLPISKQVLTQKQIATGMSEDYVWWMQKLLKINFGNPRILSYIGLPHSKSQAVTQMLLNLWCSVPITAQATTDGNKTEDFKSGETDSGGSFLAPNTDGPFNDADQNEIWRSENKEMDGLNAKGCFKIWKQQDLAPNDS
eukprot:1306460-Rhodomonas_salina.1